MRQSGTLVNVVDAEEPAAHSRGRLKARRLREPIGMPYLLLA